MSDKGLARSMTVRCKLVGGSREQGGCGAWMTSKDPIVLDRSRKVHPAPIARKPAPMLDLLKVSVVLTVQTALQRAASSLSEGLPAPLVFEWE
jgi:hypothetical protein